MLNLIRMNVYRLAHMKSAVILLVVMTAMLLLTASLDERYTDEGEQVSQIQDTGDTEDTSTAQEEEDTEDTSAEQEEEGPMHFSLILSEVDEEEENVDVQFGIYSKEPEMVNGQNPPFLGYFCSDIASGMPLIFLIILTVLFVNSEDSTGFIKNIGGQGANRSSIYLAKFPAIVCYMILLIAVSGVIQWGVLKVAHGKALVFGIKQIGEYAPILGIEFLLYMAFISGIMMVTSVTRSNVWGITVGMLTSMGLVKLLLPLILDRFFGIEDGAKYLVVQNINSLSVSADSDAKRLAVIVGVVFLLVYMLIGNLVYVKRDVV